MPLQYGAEDAVLLIVRLEYRVSFKPVRGYGLEREGIAYHFNVKVSFTHPLSHTELDENAT